jgi:nanoRNase/pAp phosphatase (c-di-AMP/oligoRNAs hydrolase)
LTENKKLTEIDESTNNEKTYQVSIRAPKNKLEGADEIAMRFGGGGRKGAAGIDILTSTSLNKLWHTLAVQAKGSL